MSSVGFHSNAALDFKFLADADDICTRVILDICVFAEDRVLGRRTGKIDRRERPESRVRDNEVQEVLHVVKKLRNAELTAAEATEQLCTINVFKSFMNKYEDDDYDIFKTHLKRYAAALRPDTGIAFHETNRYAKKLRKSAALRPTPSPTPPPATSDPSIALKTVTTRSPTKFIEVGVFATKGFKKGEIIKLQGGIADLTDEDDDQMRENGGRSDFSILWSERKKCFCLLLGPARFVNHDCRNNVEFYLVGNVMSFKVVEDIQPDEEIFTHYGLHYFERDNIGCMCATCEKLKRGYFLPKPARTPTLIKSVPPPTSPTPSRTSSRLQAIVVEGEGHHVTARRSLSRRTSTTAHLSPSRRGSSTELDFRSGPRLVNPKMRPPMLYRTEYLWDERRKWARYIGLTVVPKAKKKKVILPRVRKVVKEVVKRVRKAVKRKHEESEEEEEDEVASEEVEEEEEGEEPDEEIEEEEEEEGSDDGEVEDEDDDNEDEEGAEEEEEEEEEVEEVLKLPKKKGKAPAKVDKPAPKKNRSKPVVQVKAKKARATPVKAMVAAEPAPKRRRVSTTKSNLVVQVVVRANPKCQRGSTKRVKKVDREAREVEASLIRDDEVEIGRFLPAGRTMDELVGEDASLLGDDSMIYDRPPPSPLDTTEIALQEKARLEPMPPSRKPSRDPIGSLPPRDPTPLPPYLRRSVSLARSSLAPIDTSEHETDSDSRSADVVFATIPSSSFFGISSASRVGASSFSTLANGDASATSSSRTNGNDSTTTAASTSSSSSLAAGASATPSFRVGSRIRDGGGNGRGEEEDDDDDEQRRRRGLVNGKVDDVIMEDVRPKLEEGEEPQNAIPPAAATEVTMEDNYMRGTPMSVDHTPTPASEATSEDGIESRDTDTQEAAALLLMLNLPYSSSASATSQEVPANGHQSSSNAPTPPTPSSSASTSSIKAIRRPRKSAPNGAQSSSMQRKRSRVSVEGGGAQASSTAAASSTANPRSTRRNSQLDEPVASTSTLRNNKAGPSKSPMDRKPVVVPAPNPPKPGERGTRLTAPLAGNLSDILSTPAVLRVSGGYDAEKGKYIARGAPVAVNPDEPLFALAPPKPATPPPPPPAPATLPTGGPRRSLPGRVTEQGLKARRYSDSKLADRKPRNLLRTASVPRSNVAKSSHVVAVPPPPPARPALTHSRSTRLSAPLEGDLRALLDSETVGAVAGTYDPARGKYVSQKTVAARLPFSSTFPAPAATAGAPIAPTTPDSASVPTSSTSSEPVLMPISGATTTSEGSRGTRASRPIAGSVADLLASPTVAQVTGRFDSEKGKYVSARK